MTDDDWMNALRRTVTQEVPVEITFKLFIHASERVYTVHVNFVADEITFYADKAEDPKNFARKKVIPWILKSGQHV